MIFAIMYISLLIILKGVDIGLPNHYAITVFINLGSTEISKQFAILVPDTPNLRPSIFYLNFLNFCTMDEIPQYNRSMIVLYLVYND